MALDESSNNGFYMPVAPAYAGGNGGGFGGGFGGDWGWIILLLLFAGGGWGNGGFGGGFGGGYDFPWILTGQGRYSSESRRGSYNDGSYDDGMNGGSYRGR